MKSETTVNFGFDVQRHKHETSPVGCLVLTDYWHCAAGGDQVGMSKQQRTDGKCDVFGETDEGKWFEWS